LGKARRSTPGSNPVSELLSASCVTTSTVWGYPPADLHNEPPVPTGVPNYPEIAAAAAAKRSSVTLV
jgi:hypothetical protein